MRHTFHLKTLAVAVATLSVASVASAAGLDRSGQDITAFLQDGTYAEAVYTYIDADVTGHDNAYIGSDNKAYTPYSVHLEDVLEVWEFTCCINTQEYSKEELKLSSIMSMFQDLKVELSEMADQVFWNFRETQLPLTTE